MAESGVNRVIKFRFWDGERMVLNPTIVCGDDETLFFRDFRALEDYTPMTGTPVEFTGLHDADGKEIYEGDVVVTDPNSNACIPAVVRIGESYTSAYLRDDNIDRKYYGVFLDGLIDCDDLLVEGRMYIIGNIYENPELLKQAIGN